MGKVEEGHVEDLQTSCSYFERNKSSATITFVMTAMQNGRMMRKVMRLDMMGEVGSIPLIRGRGECPPLNL